MRFALRLFLSLAIGYCAAPISAHELGPHVHGAASLQVAIDGDTLTLVFSGPLDNLLGFEHAPHNEKQKASVRKMADTLNQAEGVFVPTPAAQCKLVSAKLDSPVLEPVKKGSGDGHADLDGEFVFRCAQPENLHNIELKLFDAFPRLHKVTAQVAGPHGQGAAQLSPTQRNLAIP